MGPRKAKPSGKGFRNMMPISSDTSSVHVERLVAAFDDVIEQLMDAAS